MEALLTAIVTWLSINFGLPADYDHPAVLLAPPADILELRYPDAPEKAQDDPSAPNESKSSVLAVYDDRKRAILLQKSWQGVTPAELSVLVHEMVHHLQARAGTIFACAAERERLAYAAQEKWLSQFGRSLDGEFAIDAMTLLVRTTCAL